MIIGCATREMAWCDGRQPTLPTIAFRAYGWIVCMHLTPLTRVEFGSRAQSAPTIGA